MSEKKKTNSIFRNYLLYLGIFTAEIIAVVGYFTWRNNRIFLNDALATKYDLAEKYQDEYNALFSIYEETLSHYYLLTGIIIFSVLAMAVTIHFLMRKWITDFKKLNYLEDITKNSREIMEKEEKYRSLFENNGTAILVVGNDEIISDCNGKFSELMGYSREEMVGIMHWSKVVHSDDFERVKGYDKSRRTDPKNAPTEYLMKLIRKDGAVRHVIVTVIVLHGTEQLASIVDITAMLEKDRQLKENQELLRQAQEIASMGSWAYYIDSSILQISEEFVSMLDLKEYGKEITLDSLRSDLHFEQFYRTVSGMIKTLSPCDTEITYLETREGFPKKTYYFKIKGRVIIEEGRPVKLIGILQDITGRKGIENEISRTNKDLKNLLYIASHDLQMPLISIEGFTSLLLNSEEGKEFDPVVRSYLERIYDNTKQMGIVFKNFFEMTRTAGSRNSFELFSSLDVITKVLSDNKLLIEKHGARICVAGKDEMPDIYGDRENIRLLFNHLISNAILYGGRNINIGYDDEKGFFVKDDGRGIKASDLEKIFLPGERLEEKTAAGTGMGLTFCRKAADIHNGRIFAESDGENKGSVFYFMPSYELIRN